MNRKVLAVGPLAALVMIACAGIMPLHSSPAGSGAGRPIDEHEFRNGVLVR